MVGTATEGQELPNRGWRQSNTLAAFQSSLACTTHLLSSGSSRQANQPSQFLSDSFPFPIPLPDSHQDVHWSQGSVLQRNISPVHTWIHRWSLTDANNRTQVSTRHTEVGRMYPLFGPPPRPPPFLFSMCILHTLYNKTNKKGRQKTKKGKHGLERLPTISASAHAS